MALYIFCAALGIPLLAMFAFSGSDGDAEFGDAGMDLDADIGGDIDFSGSAVDPGGIGDPTALLRRVPVSSYAFFLAFFGGLGVVGSWLDFGSITTFLLALVMGVLAASLNSAAFTFLRKTTTSGYLSDVQLQGRLATVSVPIGEGKRGRVWLDTGDERVQLTADAAEQAQHDNFTVGDEVLIVSVENGIASIVRVDPSLGA